jgi:hypothetical protein
MTQEQKIIRAKLGLLELAKQLGNVSRAWYFFHWVRRRAMSARSCSLAYKLFF